MPVIDELINLFKFDATDAIRNISKSDDAVKGLQEKLEKAGKESEKTKKKSKSFSSSFLKSMRSLTSAARSFTAAAAASSAGIGAWAKLTLGAIDRNATLSESIGVSYQTMQEFEFAARNSGVSVDDLRSSIEGLQGKIAGFDILEYADAFRKYGIAFQDAGGNLRPVEDVLLDISDTIQKWPVSVQGRIASEFGIGRETLILLQSGREEIQRLRKEARGLGTVVGPAAIKEAGAFRIEWTRTWESIKGLSKTLAVALSPNLRRTLAGLRQFLAENRKLIRSKTLSFFRGISDAMSDIWRAGGRVARFLGEFSDSFKKFTGGIDVAKLGYSGLIAALLGSGGALAISGGKFLLIASAIGGLVLAVEDVITHFRGGKSVTGIIIRETRKMAIQASKWIGEFVDNMKLKFNDFVDELNMKYPAIGEFFSRIAKADGGEFIEFLDKILVRWESFKKVFDEFNERISPILGFLVAQAPAAETGVKTAGPRGGARSPGSEKSFGESIGTAVEKIGERYAPIFRFFAPSIGAEGSAAATQSAPVSQASFPGPLISSMAAPVSSQTPASSHQAQGGSVTYNNTFNISGAGSPQSTASAIQRRLSESRDLTQTIEPGFQAPVSQ